MRCGAAVHRLGGQDNQLPDRRVRLVRVTSWHAFIDRALYLPKNWANDPARLKVTHVPAEIEFATKPQLAAGMIARAIAAHVPFAWVAADTVYGVGDIERDLRRVGKGYVLGVSSAHWFGSWNRTRQLGGSAEDIAKSPSGIILFPDIAF